MFCKTYHATHPDMMECVSNEELRDRYLVGGMFVEGEVNLNYSHNERFVIGGAVPKGGALKLPDQTVPASAAGKPFLERRELAAVNIGAKGAITVDGQRFEMGNKECLYIPMGSADISFEGDGARFYLASLPAHKICPIKHITLEQANPLARGDLANSNQRTIYPRRLRKRAVAAWPDRAGGRQRLEHDAPASARPAQRDLHVFRPARSE
jgi:4-deoxy-L-threo-5-hexosulose-uronate ketol-isomerase